MSLCNTPPLHFGSPSQNHPGTPIASFALPPAVLTEASNCGEFKELVTTLRIFISCVEKYPDDPVAGAVAARARAPLAQATETCVRGVIEEFRLATTTGNFKSLLSAIWFIREFCEASPSACGLVRQCGGVQMLVPVLINAHLDQSLVQEAVLLLDCLHGFEGLLEAIEHTRTGTPVVLALLLWRIRDRGRKRWDELRVIPPAKLIHATMMSMQANIDDRQVLEAALSLVIDLVGYVEYRVAFAEIGGWSHVLSVMETHRDSREVQQRGLQIFCQMQRNGAWGAEHTNRVGKVVIDALRTLQNDALILEWGLWLLLKLGGLRELLQILAEVGESSTVGLAVLKALQSTQWCEMEGAGLHVIPEAVRVVGASVLRALKTVSAEVLELGIVVLVAIARAVGALRDEELPAAVRMARQDAISVIFEVLRQRLMELPIVEKCLEVVRVYQDAAVGSAAQVHIREALLGGPSPVLLSRLADLYAHTAEAILSKVLWTHGVLLGPSAVVAVMDRLAGNLHCELAGTKTLGWLFDERDDLDAQAREARVAAVRTLTRSIRSWPYDPTVLTNACFALAAMATHGLDPEGGSYTMACLRYGLQASWETAVGLATSLDRDEASRAKARFLRQEIIRLEMESVKAASDSCRKEFQLGALASGVAAAQCESLLRDSLEGKVDDESLVGLLRDALVALGVCGQAPATVRVLQQCGQHHCNPCVARGAAAAAVDLSRLGMQQELRQAGLLEAARGAKHMMLSERKTADDTRVAEVLSALQFAEDWAS